MATMMNITNSNSIKDIACDVLGDTVILKTEVDNGAYDSLIVLQQGNTFIFKLTRRPRKGDLHNTLSSI